MRFYAARYYMSDKKWEVALYEVDPDENPHDYRFSFIPQEWKRIGGKAPKKDEVIQIKLSAETISCRKQKS